MRWVARTLGWYASDGPGAGLVEYVSVFKRQRRPTSAAPRPEGPRRKCGPRRVCSFGGLCSFRLIRCCRSPSGELGVGRLASYRVKSAKQLEIGVSPRNERKIER
jgi:hypothetical protein